MGVNVNNNFSNQLFETCQTIGLMGFLALSAIPMIITPNNDENYFPILKSSISGALIGAFSIANIICMKQLKNMTSEEWQSSGFQRYSEGILRYWESKMVFDIGPSQTIIQRKNALCNVVKQFALFTFACSLAFLGNAYYLSYRHFPK